MQGVRRVVLERWRTRRTLHGTEEVKRYWLCRGCGTRNERTKRKCAGKGCKRSRPAPRVPKHAKTIQGDTYDHYKQVAEKLHGITDESCCVCGRPRAQAIRHHRDHDHVTGDPRGIACFQCNNMMPRSLTLDMARAIVAYLERASEYRVVFPQGVDSAVAKD